MTIEQELELTAAALAAVERIVDTVRAARNGTADPAVALAALAAFEHELASNNAAADAALAAKFPK